MSQQVDLKLRRNIGISAHIDSGKTTLTERILFYSRKIHRMHEVRGKDGKGATMDSMELERERGITIQSASTTVNWQGYQINIIDTPGHVDFTIEVERALRVLDGAVLVLCSVGGVQSQTITVDRQFRRYNVPIVAFINKLDRTGANPTRVINQMREQLGRNPVPLQLPIGLEEKHQGVVDLVTMKALYFEGKFGEVVKEEPIPPEMEEEARQARERMLDAATMFSDELMEAVLESRETPEQIIEALRRGTIAQDILPVLMGSAYRNKGVQPLIDAVGYYLPHPGEVVNEAFNYENPDEKIKLSSSPDDPTVALAFKLEDTFYGQLTYIRLYQGKIKKGDELFNSRSRSKFRVGRIGRMHADEMEDIEEALAGDIVALFGIDCLSGDTFVSPGLNLALTPIHVPEPVISLAVKPTDQKVANRMARALQKFAKEDPTFRVYVDPESQETIIQGMGELHLEVYLERMRREFKASVETGPPQVAYRETITQKANFDYTHKKQTGGAGQYGRVMGYLEPQKEKPYEFVDLVKGGKIPREFIPSCDKGFQQAMAKGPLTGFPVTGVRVVLTDGQDHPVDSSDLAFQVAAREAFRQAYLRAKPVILEPIMKVSVEGPSEYIGSIFASLNQRRGIIVSSSEDGQFARVDAEVPLKEMFGYSTTLRSLTQGKATFTMEFLKYQPLPAPLAEKIQAELAEKNKKAQVA